MILDQKEWEFLNAYMGTNPIPEDFDSFWKQRVDEAERCPLEYHLEPSEIPNCDTCEFWNLYFTGIRGEKVYAKYIKPVSGERVPLVLQFHGYPGASRSWFEQASFAGMGCALLAMDCPGQGGFSQDAGGYEGTTVTGHLVAGLDGDPREMYYVRLYQDICLLCRIVPELDGIDLKRVFINGASQGGGLGLVCAALNPSLPRKAAILYPFLSDFQKVWELGRDEIAYEGLRYYSRWFDPDGSKKTELFTKLGYIDVHNFAHLVRCEVLFGTGLSDAVCPPVTQFSVYNRLTCPKRHVFFPEYGHEEIQDFDDQIITFFGEERQSR